MSEKELPPCPFCGSGPVEDSERDTEHRAVFKAQWTCSTLQSWKDRELHQSKRCEVHAASVKLGKGM